MSSYLVPELTYELPALPENVVVSRQEVMQQSSSSSHEYSSTPVIRFAFNGDQFMDLGSLRIFANINTQITSAGPTSSVTSDVSNVKLLPPSTYHLFQSIEVSTGSGVVIERIDDAALLAEIMMRSTWGNQWALGDGSFSNAQLQPHSRAAYTAPSSTNAWEISAHKLLGFLNSGKYLHLNSIGGLVLTLTLANPVTTHTGRAANEVYTCSLSNVRAFTSMITPTESYRRFYDEQYRSQGFRMYFDVHGYTSNTVSSVSSQSLQLALTAKRAKCIVTVMRTVDNITASNKSSYSFWSTGWTSYQYSIDGVPLPAVAVDGYARAHANVQNVCNTSKDAQVDNSLSLTQFTTNFALAAGDGTLANQLNGSWICAIDLERYSSTEEAGMSIAPGSLMFNFNNTTATGAQMISTYVLKSAAMTVVDGIVSIDS